MDVIFELQNGATFSVEIGFFDKIVEIKEKIEKYKNIPVAHQTLIFNGKVLDDEDNVGSCQIFHNSRIGLAISGNLMINSAGDEQRCTALPIASKVRVVLRMHSSKSQVALDVDLNDTVRQLKERIRDIEGVAMKSLVLQVNGKNELQDNRYLREYNLTDGFEIDVLVRAPPHAASGSKPPPPPMPPPRKLKAIVVSRCETKKVILHVNPHDKIQVIRKQLEKQTQEGNFILPEEGYFFIHKQSVMEEDESFYWHNFRQGDVIDVFNGRVTRGP